MYFSINLELPFLFSITELAEVLLRVKYGPLVLCNLLVNNPDYFQIGILLFFVNPFKTNVSII